MTPRRIKALQFMHDAGHISLFPDRHDSAPSFAMRRLMLADGQLERVGTLDGLIAYALTLKGERDLREGTRK